MKINPLARKKIMLATSISVLSLLSINAIAAGVLEEIIVTAQRRAENVQDVPIAISAFSENFLAETGIDTVENLPMVTPGFNYTTQLGGAAPILRGVGNPGTNIGQESSVATYVDDVYYSSSSGADLSLNNIERIEILKGPQGTLFGRNATGGLIHIITKDPSHETSGKIELSYGNYATSAINFYGTTELSDTVAVDLALRYQDQADGWGKNLATGNDVNEGDDLMIRNKWLIEPSDRTKITLGLDYFENKGSFGVSTRPADGALGLDGLFTFLFLTTPVADGGLGLGPATAVPLAIAAATKAPQNFHDINMAIDPFTEHEQWGVSLKVEHQFGEMDFVSITAYRDAENIRFLDQESTAAGLFEITLPSFTETFTQEFRLSGSQGDFQWIAGAFILEEELGWNQGNLDIVGPLGGGLTRLNTAGEGDNSSWAVFVQGGYDLTDSTKLTVGIRYTEDKKEISGRHNFYVGDVLALGPVPWDQAGTFSETTWRLALEHNFSDDVLGYISHNRGFKAGFLDLIATEAAAGQPITITEPEVLDAYEIGFKSEFMDGRARLNGAAFYYEFTDKHEQSVTPGGSATINAAEATMTGAELELLAVVSDGLTMHAGVSWIDSEYDSFPEGQIFSPSGFGGNVSPTPNIVDHTGNQIARTPEYTFNLGFVYVLDTDMGPFTSSVNYYYNNGFFQEPENRLEQESYSVVNAQISWESSDETFSIRLYANNLADEEYVSYGTSSGVGDVVSVAAPRTYGIKLGYSF